MLTDTAGQRLASFFGMFLTRRHFVTRWAIPGVLTLGVATAVLGPWGADLAGFGGDAGAENAQGGGAPAENARVLKVNVKALGAFSAPELWKNYTGIVVARRSSQLAAKALGRVDEVLVDIGDQVKAGQALVQLDREQLVAELAVSEAALASAKDLLRELESGPRNQDKESAAARVDELEANLSLARANLARSRELRRKDAISKQELDENEYQVQAFEAQLKSASQQLLLLQEGTREESIGAQRNQVASLLAARDRVNVRLEEQVVVAPYAGQIQSRQVDEGDIVSPGQLMLEIVESGALEVRVGIPAKHLAVVDFEPSNVRLASMGAPGQFLQAKIDGIAPAVDAVTRTRQCVFRLEESAGQLVSIGDAVSVSIRTQPEMLSGQSEWTAWVPQSCLVAGPRGLWVVYVAVPADNGDNYLIEGRRVEVLRAYGGWSQVTGPPVSAESLVVTGVDDEGDLQSNASEKPLGDSSLLVTDGLHRIVPGQLVKLSD